jgi:hypothetical protein
VVLSPQYVVRWLFGLLHWLFGLVHLPLGMVHWVLDVMTPSHHAYSYWFVAFSFTVFFINFSMLRALHFELLKIKRIFFSLVLLALPPFLPPRLYPGGFLPNFTQLVFGSNIL